MAKGRRDAVEAEFAAFETEIGAEGREFTDADRERLGALTKRKTDADRDVREAEEAIAAFASTPAVKAWNSSGQELALSGGRVTNMKDLAAEKPWGADTGAGFGEFLQAVYRAGAGAGMDRRLLATATGMGEAVGADGGFAVPMEYAAGIEKEMWESGQILSRVNERPIQGNAITFTVIDETSRADGSRRGGVRAYWVDEGTAPDASRIKLARVEMKLRKLGAFGYISDELMADAPALAAELTEAFREEIMFEVEDSLLNGTGAGQPQGVLNANCLVTVTEETGQSPDTIVYENVQKMWARMPAGSRGRSAWFIHYDAEPQLNQMSMVIGTGGVPVYLPPGGLSTSPYGTLFGRPVIPTEYNAALGDLGDIVLADWGRYRVIRASQGVEQAQSMHVRFSQGEQTFRAFYRVDGQAIPRSAITPKNGSNTLSPFVVLSAR